MKVSLFAWLAPALAVGAAPARAEWIEVKTDHFILTIDSSQAEALQFANSLERFDGALRKTYGVEEKAGDAVRPITIFALKPGLFQEVCYCRSAVGYYEPRSAGSYIVSMHMPSSDRKAKIGSWSSQTVLLHEYSHHFAYAHFPMAYPKWFAEGFAEFNANASFEADGSVILGYPANYRAEAIKGRTVMSYRQLFEPENRGFGGRIDQFYGRAWLLTHFLMGNPGRKRQLSAYLDALNRGAPSLKAAEGAFGDLKQLNTQLNSYARGRLNPPLRVFPAPVSAPRLTLLSPARAEMASVYARLGSGLPKSEYRNIAGKAAKVAAKDRKDGLLQVQWGEAELVARRPERAVQAADFALSADPNLVPALILKGWAAAKAARASKRTDTATWSAARKWIVRANRAAPDAVMPLYLFYLSYAWPQHPVPANAIKGLMRAHVLAPEASEIRKVLARQMLIEGNASQARAYLAPLAFSPHSKSDENKLRQIIELLDAGKMAEARTLADAEDEEDKG